MHLLGRFTIAIVALTAIVAGCGGGSSADPRDAAIVAAVQQTPLVAGDVLTIETERVTYLNAVERAGGLDAVSLVLIDEEPAGVQPSSNAEIWLVELTVGGGAACETYSGLVNDNGRAFAGGIRGAECPAQAEIVERDRALLGAGSRLASPAPAIEDVELSQTELGDALDDVEGGGYAPEAPSGGDENDARPVWVASFTAYIGPPSLGTPEEGAPAPACEEHVRVLDEESHAILYQGQRACDD